MTIEKIIKRFKANRYRVALDFSTSRIVVRDPRGFMNGFDSYAEAYKYYFSPKRIFY